MKLPGILAIALLTLSLSALADDFEIPMHLVSGPDVGACAGFIVAKDTPYGLLLIPDMHHLLPGVHGFHVHVNPSCDDAGNAAGGHLDPKNTGKHLGPYDGAGHLGDLPVLIAAADGTATLAVLAPRLKIKDILNHALMVHVGGDNYSDVPAKLGGGGARLACGVVPDLKVQPHKAPEQRC